MANIYKENSDFETQKQNTFPLQNKDRQKEILETLYDNAFLSTKTEFGLPAEWNIAQCLGFLSKEDAQEFNHKLIHKLEIEIENRMRYRQPRTHTAEDPTMSPTHMWPVYLADCRECGFEHTYRHVLELPEGAECMGCGKSLESVGYAAFEAICLYCSHHNFFPEFFHTARCEKCSFLIRHHDTESEVVGITKMVVAGVKTSDRETILIIIVAVIGVLMALWAVM